MAVNEANDNETEKIKKSENDQEIEMPALGRPFRLGMLYDRNRDCFLPGECLFPSELVEKHVVEGDQKGTNCVLMAGDSYEEKSLLFENDKSLQFNALFGLAHVGSSGKHLIKPKTSNDIVKVAFGVNISTKYKELKVRELFQRTDKHLFQQKRNATHIVSAITYGGHIAFELERTVEKGEIRSDVEKGMMEAASLFRLVSEENKDKSTVEAQMTFRHKNITCKFYGDVVLNQIPTTYEESLECYKQIPSFVKDNNVPVKVCLFPLSELFPGTIPEIIDVVQDVRLLNNLEELGSIRSEIKSLMKSRSSNFIPDVVRKLNSVQIEAKKIEEDLRAFVIKNRIRKDSHNALFDSEPIKLKKMWLENAIEEIKVLDLYIGKLGEKGFIKSDSADLEATIIESDELAHLTVSLPLLRQTLTVKDKDVIKNTLRSDKGRGQSSNSVFTEILQGKLKVFDEDSWIKSSDLMNLFRKYMKKMLTSSSRMAYAVTFVDINSSKNQENCFRVDVYKSSEAANDPDFDFFDD